MDGAIVAGFAVALVVIVLVVLFVADRALRRGAKAGYALAAVITATGTLIVALIGIVAFFPF